MVLDFGDGVVDLDARLVLFVCIFVAGYTFVLPVDSVNTVADG